MVVMAATGRGLAAAGVVVESGTAASADWNLPTVKVEVDWTGTGVWVDESAACRGVHITRGRARVNDLFGGGSASVVLRNLDGRYAPFNPASALYPNVAAARPVRLTASYRGVSTALFAGFLSEPVQTVAFREAAVAFACIDAFEHFRLATASAARQSGQRVDQIVQAILTAVGWTGGVSLDTGSTIPQYDQPSGSTLQGLQHAALQDVVGKLYMTAAGAVRFEAAGARNTTPVWHLFTSVEAQQLSNRQSDLVSTVDVSYSTVQSAALTPSATTTLTLSFTLGATAPDLAAIGVTAWDHADGSGQNLSEAVWVRSLSVSGRTASLTLENGAPLTAYVTAISGNGLGSLVGPTLSVPAVGSLVGSQPLVAQFDAVTDTARITAWAQRAGAAFRTSRPRPVVTVVGRTPELLHMLLGADLGTRIALQDTAGVWLSGLNNQFFIEHLDLTLGGPGQIPTATWQLFDDQQGSL